MHAEQDGHLSPYVCLGSRWGGLPSASLQPPAPCPAAWSHVDVPSVPAGAMTQQPQEDFDGSVEDARAWMRAVQERLQVNDDTQGPRAALEARLRETEVRRAVASMGPEPPCPACRAAAVLKLCWVSVSRGFWRKCRF